MSADQVEPPPEEGGAAPRQPGYRRFAPLILIAGAVAAVISILPHIPKERRVELRLEDPASIVEVELRVVQSSDGELVQGSDWHFSAGGAPAVLRTSMKLGTGEYAFDVTVERPPDRRSIHRVIALDDSDQITIPVR